jgi:cell wall-associated NlpC family hydrolase
MLFLSVCALVAAVCFPGLTSAQDRDRVIKTTSSQPTNLPAANTQPTVVIKSSTSRPTLTNEIKVARPPDAAWEPPVKKTASSMPMNSAASMAAAGKAVYTASTSSRIDQAIKSRYGIPYRYGSSGPNTYDCSGFVWSVFQEAGIDFTRSSARSLWAASEPVEGADRYKYGTLVFLNGLGHMGIVADENGFYHASSSKGITYSTFKGYWEKRIVGFRKLNTEETTEAK